jgi:thiol-disulfide isomerase/thioredoxin
MSSQKQDQYQDQEFGGRKRRNTAKIHGKKNVVVVGKVYADWCGHCQSLKPEWAKMKKHIYSKKGRKHVVFVEIEEKQIGEKMQKLEQDHGVKVEANGYPTLFRIEGGKVKYYNGQRQSDPMTNWYLRGGDSSEKEQELDDSPMPGLMEDLQGGRRDSFTRLHGTKRQFRRYPNTRKFKHSNFTRRMYPRVFKGNDESVDPYATRKQRTPKKPSGIFSFLFGK